jgi:hypothetical protein
MSSVLSDVTNHSDSNGYSDEIKNTVSNSPFKIFQPYNLAVLLTLISPIIVTIIIISISFVFQNFKGFIYLIWLILFVCIREFILNMSGMSDIDVGGGICNDINYSKYGNNTFSMFFISFSLIYFCSPMVINNEANYWVIGGFLFYLILDVWMRFYIGCIENNDMAFVFLNLVFGVASAIAVVVGMYITNNQKYLFFNEASKNKDICSMPKKQTFHCSVYKNGELIG